MTRKTYFVNFFDTLVYIWSHWFVLQLLTAKLLEMWAHCANTSMEPLSALIDSSIDSSASDQSRLHQSLLKFMNIPEHHLVDTLLYDSQTL